MPTGGGGGGGGGLSSVATNSTLTGNGTGGSPLGISGWPVGYITKANAVSAAALGSANNVNITGFVLDAQMALNFITVKVNTIDAVNNSDLGIYSAAGARLAHIGAQTMPSTGVQTFAVIGAPINIGPGRLLFAWTSNATTLQLTFSNTSWSWCQVSNGGVGVAGALPVSISAPSVAINENAYAFALT